jgi:GNAT superfamily N-acetyltransferase
MRKTNRKLENLEQESLEDKLVILPLDETNDFSFFNCKNEELNDFLKNDALIDQGNLVNRTRLCFFNGSLVGYYSLSAVIIKMQSVIDGIESFPYEEYPAIKIVRLAIDSRFEGLGIGTFLMKFILVQVVSICDSIGCRYLLVDSKPGSIGFYKKFDFKVAEKNKRTKSIPMYLNMQPYVQK